MGNLATKSETNLKAARLLLKEHFYSSVCHPAYYACFQLTKDKLIEKGISTFPPDEKEKRLGSHKYMIKEAKRFICAQKGRQEAEFFDRKIKKLKAYRTTADYKDGIISPECANISLTTATHLHEKIKQL